MQDVLLFVTVGFAALGSWWVIKDHFRGFKRLCFSALSAFLLCLFFKALRGQVPEPAWVATGSFITIGLMWTPLLLEWMGNTISMAGSRHADYGVPEGPPDFCEARTAFNDGREKEAVALIYRQLEKHPHSYEGRMLLATHYLERKRPKKAVKELEWLKNQPDLTEAQAAAVAAALRQAEKLIDIGY